MYVNGVNTPLCLQLAEVRNSYMSTGGEDLTEDHVRRGHLEGGSAKLQVRNGCLNTGPFGTRYFRLTPSLAALQQAELWCDYCLAQIWPISGLWPIRCLLHLGQETEEKHLCCFVNMRRRGGRGRNREVK